MLRRSSKHTASISTLSAAINAQTSATGVAASVDANGALLLTENFNVKNEDILILCIIDLTELGGSNLIREKGYSIKTIVNY